MTTDVIYIAANRSMVKVKHVNPLMIVSRERRGQVVGFSAKSRKRLFDWLNTIDWSRSGLPLFVTLTYGQAFPGPRDSKRHLREFVRRLTADRPGLAVLWRIELQARGAPHFHLMVWGVERIEKEVIRDTWGDVVGERYWDNVTGLPPFTRIEKLRSVRGARWYVGKYVAKVQQGTCNLAGSRSAGGAPLGAPLGGPDGESSPGFNYTPYLQKLGRCWGVINRVSLPRDRLAIVGRMTGYRLSDILGGTVSAKCRGVKPVNGSYTIYFREDGHGIKDLGEMRRLCEKARECSQVVEKEDGRAEQRQERTVDAVHA